MIHVFTCQVAVCSSGPVTCVTTTVAASVLQDCHIFGHQMAIFPDVPLHLDLVLVVRAYVGDGSTQHDAEMQRQVIGDQTSDSGTWNSPRTASTPSRTSMETKAGVAEDNFTLVAWSFLPLAIRGETKH